MTIHKNIIAVLFFFISFTVIAQTNADLNGIKSTVIGPLSANAEQAKRYEIVSIGYNSYHWQAGGLVMIELYSEYFATGYEKYILEIGSGQGTTTTSPVLKLTESYGLIHSGKIVLGTPADLSTSTGGYINKKLSIYFDVRYYARYRIKITYLQQKVDTLTDLNQIKIDDNPIATNISDFSASNALSTSLNITGNGDHYIQNGNVGIGTTNPKNKLDVKGTIRSQEVKVSVENWSDFVFKKEYNLPTLEQVEKHITEKGHLENIPNEEEVLKNGINVGEMNAKLLQKIEELTLYMIEMKKENEKQNKKQNEEIERLQTKLISK
ncbi:hypothetical protein [Flavobacterium branchiicola]|uniref:Uncharacterized protein n=1 Tax=Flavobacterium branchiicola TaxID=1114875 RepID=A0ABV9PIX2_9FLAO|nr:hypothetical protein [Flavobacterium branchiicola]MBS7256727.1 hypothetical protein [Flavobacterium branchiicola]